MKKLFSILCLLVLIATPAFAKTGSGGQPATPPPAAEEPAPAPKAAVSAHCGTEKTIRARVSCRLKASPEKIQVEQDTAYFPEGCRRGTPDWQEKCKTRYKTIGPCWYDEELSSNQYEGGEVVGCLKEKLQLPKVLVPTTQFCEGKEATCPEDYKKAVHHLIVARFYDAEERAELLLEEEKVSIEDGTDFITFISEAKLRFYDAKTKSERLNVINDVIANWKNLIQKVK